MIRIITDLFFSVQVIQTILTGASDFFFHFIYKIATHECAGLSSALCDTSNLKLALEKKKKKNGSVKDRCSALPAGTCPRSHAVLVLHSHLPPVTIFLAPPWGVTTAHRGCPLGWSPLRDQPPRTSHVPPLSATLTGTGKGTASCDPGYEVRPPELGTHPPGRRRGFYARLPRGSWARGQPAPHRQAVAPPLPERSLQKAQTRPRPSGKAHAFHAGGVILAIQFPEITGQTVQTHAVCSHVPFFFFF